MTISCLKMPKHTHTGSTNNDDAEKIVCSVIFFFFDVFGLILSITNE